MRRDGVLSLFLAALVALVLFTGGPAEAGPKDRDKLLRGEYAFSGATSCLVSRGGFNPNFTPLGPPAPFPFVISFSVQGVRTFNGDGTGKFVGRLVSFSHPFALPTDPAFFSRSGAGSSDFEGDFTYEVAPDRTVTIENMTISGTVLTGTETGQTFSIANVPPFSGLMSTDRRTLTVNHDVPGVETITFSDGDVQHRICLRSRIHLKLKSGDDND